MSIRPERMEARGVEAKGTTLLQSASDELNNLISFEHVRRGNDHILSSYEVLKQILDIVRSHPVLAKNNFADQGRVLHHIARFRPPLEIVKAIYHAYPQAIFERNTDLRTPLHLYTINGCNPLVVDFLLQQNPMALSASDIACNLPIHWLTECHFSVPQVTRRFVQVAPDSVTKRILYPGCHRRTLLEAALTGRGFLSDADLARNEESIRVLVNAYPQVLAEVVEYAGSDEQAIHENMKLRNELYTETMSSLHLHSLLQSKPTHSLVTLFLSVFPEAVRVRDSEGWTILMHGQIIECLTLNTKRVLIQHSVELNTMTLEFRSITPQLTMALVEEADYHTEVSNLSLYVNHKISFESHWALMTALGKATTIHSFSLNAPARHNLPMSAAQELCTFFSLNTPMQRFDLDICYHSSAFEGLCNNSHLYYLVVRIAEDVTDNLHGLARVLRTNRIIEELHIHVNSLCYPDVLWDALRINTSLKVLRFHGPSNYKNDLVDVLATHNSTLQQVSVHLPDQLLHYYCRLNQAGKAMARNPGTTKGEFVRLLVTNIFQVDIIYGLLLDVPALWSS
jgi:ankyrin repeat protein